MVMYSMICAVAIKLLYHHVQNMGGQVSYYPLHDRRLYNTYHLFVVGVVIIYGHVSMICAVAIELLYSSCSKYGWTSITYSPLHDRRLYNTYHLFVVGVVIIYGHVSNDLCCGNRIIILIMFKIWVDKFHIILSMIEDYTIHITFL